MMSAYFRMDSFLSFMESSSIGGLPQINASRTWLGKIYWMVAVAISSSLTAYLVTEAFIDWANNPIKTTTETFPIYDVQFPNITVCPPQVAFGFTILDIA